MSVTVFGPIDNYYTLSMLHLTDDRTRKVRIYQIFVLLSDVRTHAPLTPRVSHNLAVQI